MSIDLSELKTSLNQVVVGALDKVVEEISITLAKEREEFEMEKQTFENERNSIKTTFRKKVCKTLRHSLIISDCFGCRRN